MIDLINRFACMVASMMLLRVAFHKMTVIVGQLCAYIPCCYPMHDCTIICTVVYCTWFISSNATTVVDVPVMWILLVMRVKHSLEQVEL